MSRDITLVTKGSRDVKVEITENPHPTKFGADRYCVSGDMMGLVCHVIS